MKRKRGNRISVKLAIISLLIVVLLSIGLTAFFYSFYIIAEVKEIPISFEIAQNVGLDASTDRLNFGKIMPSGYSKRFLTIENHFSFPVEADISFEGKTSDYVKLSENNFLLGPGEKKEISITASAPGNSALGEYSGFMRVLLKRV